MNSRTRLPVTGQFGVRHHRLGPLLAGNSRELTGCFSLGKAPSLTQARQVGGDNLVEGPRSAPPGEAFALPLRGFPVATR